MESAVVRPIPRERRTAAAGTAVGLLVALALRRRSPAAERTGPPVPTHDAPPASRRELTPPTQR
jgi:hypothetical protein